MRTEETIAFQILGISQDTEFADARKAYRSLVKLHHPDKGGSADRFREVQAAWEVIKTYYERLPISVQYTDKVRFHHGTSRQIHTAPATDRRTASATDRRTASATDRRPEGRLYLVYDQKRDVYIRYGYIYDNEDTAPMFQWIQYKKVDSFRYICLYPDISAKDKFIPSSHPVCIIWGDHTDFMEELEKTAVHIRKE